MITARIPGTTRFVSHRSAFRIVWRGKSPTGTLSGASCNLITCESTNRHLSWTITNGSIGQLFLPPSALVLSQFLGKEIAENPPWIGMVLVVMHDRHIAVTWVALELSVEAPMTMPGIRTSLPMYSDCVEGKNYFFLLLFMWLLTFKSRIWTTFSFDFNMTWQSGTWTLLLGLAYKIRLADSLTAFSN